jgi:mannosyl-3-phosphoglycerate synthase
MILELPKRTEHIGSVSLHDIQKVYELDSGSRKFDTKAREAVATISRDDIDMVNKRMAIVVPVKDEKSRLLEGVLSGIPHDCSVIIISNSTRSPVDRFETEKQIIKEFNHFVQDDILLIHQQDPGLSAAFRDTGFSSILDESGAVRNGKAEGMFTGILLAKMIGKEFVGFIDSDNYVPGAVHEYVEIYGAGFLMSESPYSMVRVSWVNKPKVAEDKLQFPKWGRVSEVSNQWLNRVVESHTGFGTDVIKTGNSGEHAMSIKLAELLYYATGFAVEPFEIVNILEQFGGISLPVHPEPMSRGVDVFQIETRNPHLHEEKGDEHIQEMLQASIGAIYSSPICPKAVREAILSANAGSDGSGKPMMEYATPVKIKPPIEVSLDRFVEILKQESRTLTWFR